MPTWDDVVQLGTQLPGVEVGTSYGAPALRVRGKGMCRLRSDPDALAIRVTDMGEREALLQSEPETFFTTPHYDGYPYVLVRLEAVDPDELGELLEDAWRVFAAKRIVKEWDATRDRAGESQ
ncbi:MAG: MmcQ/YjbR family DNA-binding protein [Solirubrobacteraceae bacterium]|nr:MmcQ/YjbR family DNA-binding protein [Solirubrobacteraceae bacterium]